MTIYASRTTRGFYDSSINEYMPDDVVEISKELHTSLILGQSSSKEIQFGSDGVPFLADADFTQQELEMIERAWRDSELLRADIELYKVQDADSKAVGTVTAWRDYRKALRAWPAHLDFPDKAKRPVAP